MSHWETGSRDTMSFKKLSEDEKITLLRDNGCLFGIRIDNSTGPRRSAFQLAQRKSARPIHVQEKNEIATEVIKTSSERETNYVHQGWSPSAISTQSPWTLSRIANMNNVHQDVPSITKRVIIKRLEVEVPMEDLEPSPEFKADVLVALGKSTNLQRFQALHQVLERWGDAIPLVFDLGVSLAITDLESSTTKYLTEKSYFGLRDLTTSGTAKISTQGGDRTVLESNVQKWLREPVPMDQWSQVRIVKAVPITDLLEGRIKAQLAELHKSLITYTPITLSGVTSAGQSFDDASHALKTISTVTVCCDSSYLKSLLVAYRDGTQSDIHGGSGGTANVFELTTGEHITELVVWKDAKWVYAVQFITDIGRASKHYGGDGGTPTILRGLSPGCLAAFSGTIKSDIVHQLQAIWRHDIQCASLSGERQHSEYYGGAAGSAFNDWPFVKHMDSVYISSIRVKYGKYIDGIQITYAIDDNSSTTNRAAPYHGGSGHSEKTFHLEPGEHIVTVLGRFNKYVVQLCFVTNRGRVSDIYGGGDGEDFVCRAPQTSERHPMRLHYIVGKCSDRLNGILFVWAPI